MTDYQNTSEDDEITQCLSEKPDLDLKTLKYIKSSFNIYSDHSCSTLGYKNILKLIDEIKKEKIGLLDNIDIWANYFTYLFGLIMIVFIAISIIIGFNFTYTLKIDDEIEVIKQLFNLQ